MLHDIKTGIFKEDKNRNEIKVWDIAIRLFHWSLVLTFAFALVSAEQWDQLHIIAGYTVTGLIAFRIIWGFIGSKHARFSDFIYSPSQILNFLHDSLTLRARRYIGHNPIGGVMVIVLLLSLIFVTATGYAMTTTMFYRSEWMEELHEFASHSTVLLVILHIAGVIIASLKDKENLVKSMITGFKRRKND